MPDMEGFVTTCPECDLEVVMLEGGVVIDEDSELEHKCSDNPYPDLYESDDE